MNKLTLKNIIVIISTLTVTLGVNTVSNAKPLGVTETINSEFNLPVEIAQQRRGRDDDEGDDNRFWSKLNLSAEQKNQMQTIRKKYQPETSSLRDQIETEREKLDKMMQSNESDSNLRAQHGKIVNLDEKMHNLRFESMLEMRKVLTTEQRQQFSLLMEEKRANRQGDRKKP